MLVQSPEGKMEVIDFREVAPGSSTRDMFGKERSASVTVRSYTSFMLRSYSRDLWHSIKSFICFFQGGLSVAVPGQVQGLEMAHKKFGKYVHKNNI